LTSILKMVDKGVDALKIGENATAVKAVAGATVKTSAIALDKNENK